MFTNDFVINNKAAYNDDDDDGSCNNTDGNSSIVSVLNCLEMCIVVSIARIFTANYMNRII